MKKCNTCDIEKPLIEFCKNNKGKGGLSQSVRLALLNIAKNTTQKIGREFYLRKRIRIEQ